MHTSAGRNERPTYLQHMTRAQEARCPRQGAWFDPNATHRTHNPELGQERTTFPYKGTSYSEGHLASTAQARPPRNAWSASMEMQILLADGQGRAPGGTRFTTGDRGTYPSPIEIPREAIPHVGIASERTDNSRLTSEVIPFLHNVMQGVGINNNIMPTSLAGNTSTTREMRRTRSMDNIDTIHQLNTMITISHVAEQSQRREYR